MLLCSKNNKIKIKPDDDDDDDNADIFILIIHYLIRIHMMINVSSARMSDNALTSQQMPKLQAVSLQFAVCKYLLSHFRRLPASSSRGKKG